MGKTKRWIPKNGEFKKLRTSSKKIKNKKQRQSKAKLTKHLKFASEHREHLDITAGRHAAMYMENSE